MLWSRTPCIWFGGALALSTIILATVAAGRGPTATATPVTGTRVATLRFSPAGGLYLIQGNPTSWEIEDLRASSWPQQYAPGQCPTIPGGLGVMAIINSPNFFEPPYNLDPRTTAVEITIKAKVKVQGADHLDVRPEGALFLAVTYQGDPITQPNAVIDAYATRRQRTVAVPDNLTRPSEESTGESIFEVSNQINFARVTARIVTDPNSPGYGRFQLYRISSLMTRPQPFSSQAFEPYHFGGSGYPTVYADHNVYLVGYYAP